MSNVSSSGVIVEEFPGVFHLAPDARTDAAGPISLLDGRNLPFQRGSIAVGPKANLQPDWEYVNVKHFSVFIEQSLQQGLQAVVFQKNGPSLWLQVANLIDNFFTNQWQQGRLQGKRKQDAYFVRCDSSTMTQNDLDNGKLVALVGFAPLRPAEFVVIQIGILTKNG